MTEEATGGAPQVEENNLPANEDVQEQPGSSPEHSGEPASQERGEAAPAEEKGVPDGVQQRINEITRKRREAERRAERAEARLKALESQDLSEMDYDDQLAERTIQRSRKQQIEEDRETAQELAAEAYQARVDIASVKYPDFAQVTNNPNLNITAAMAETIVDSEHGPDIAYHLGKNPAEAARISKLNPVSQARELGRIEATVSMPKRAPNPAAAPVKPVGGRASGGTKDPTKMSMAEYIAWRGNN